MAETSSAGKDARQYLMIRKSLVWLVLACPAVAVAPAIAQDPFVQLPDRNPDRADPSVRTAEAPLPERNPAINGGAGHKTPAVPSPERNPGLAENFETVPPSEDGLRSAETTERVLPWERIPSSEAVPESTPAPERNPVSAETPEDAPAPNRNPVSEAIPESTPAPERNPVSAETPEDATEPTPLSAETPEAATDDSNTSEDETVVSAPDDAPLPDRKPPPGDRPTLAWMNPKVAAARDHCATLLEGHAIEYETLQPIRRGACGAPAPILVKSVGTNPAVKIVPPATVRCRLAAALDTWFKDQVQPAAMAAFGEPVVKIRNISSYKCRNRYNARNTRISEHAFANALDVSTFVLASGDAVTLLDNWRRPPPLPPLPPPPDPKPLPPSAEVPITKVTMKPAVPPRGPTPAPKSLAQRKSEFLRGIHADGCKTFNTVLGPAANAAHKNHFHFDMKVRRYVKICQ